MGNTGAGGARHWQQEENVKLVLKKKLVQEIGESKFAPFGVGEDVWTWKDAAPLDLIEQHKRMPALEALLQKHKGVRGVGVLLRDIASWRAALADASTVKARTVLQFERLLKEYLSKVPGHRIYLRESEDVSLPFYVGSIAYCEEVTRRDHHEPEKVRVVLHWDSFGERSSSSLYFQEEECRALTVVEALARKGYYAETPELRARHVAEMEHYRKVAAGIGGQFWAHGVATNDVDGNSGWRVTTFQMVRDAAPTRVVVDVFYESAETDRPNKSEYIDSWFWSEDDDETDGEERPAIEIPVHPYLAIFDMSKHLRLRIHVGYLTPYEYDVALADKLVLPAQMKALVHMLIARRAGAFTDIIRGKSGGAVILLAGPPGVGKTLTAEVYAESEQRALYSVQCSQLGTDAAALEEELLKVFARATRWRAVLLLDEADVYVHERGRDLQQNAIVGVFLRVLEYQDTVLFLTTNRPDDVDDAIASRCIARLTYPRPTQEEQRQIWRILAEATNARISGETIDRIVERNPGLSGRDIKNLLKLAMLTGTSGDLTVQDVEFVRQFQPTIA